MGTPLTGRTALVTGGARGIGAAIVRRLHADGANVAITDVLEAEGRALATELGERARFFAHDVTDDGAWRDVVERSEEHTSELQSRENIVCRLLLEKKTIYGKTT